MRFTASILVVLVFALSAFAQSTKGTVTGRVVDAKGKSISGAHVRALGVSGASGAQALEATTDAKGEFRLEVDAGQYRLEFEAEGYASTSLRDPVSVSAGKQTKLKGKISLPEAEQGSVIRGSIFTEQGRSIPAAKVTLERVAVEGVTQKELKLESQSDRMGLFSFRVPKGEGRYRITASLKGFGTRSTTVDVFGGEISNISIKLPPADGE